MKGIILAGGKGTRLAPVTKLINKHLLPVYDKPMIYYPLSVLMLADIREILIISTEEAIPQFQTLLGHGEHLGVSIEYAVQPEANGLAEAFIIGRTFLAGEPCALILGDNLFFGSGLPELLSSAKRLDGGAKILAYQVANPRDYGVLKLDSDNRVVDIIEKPADPPSRWAVPGLYFFNGEVADIAAEVKPSARGELEITEVIKAYLKKGSLSVEWVGRGYAWLDMGTHESLLQASQFIETVESRQMLKIACLEEIAFRRGFIDIKALRAVVEAQPKTPYSAYLELLLTNVRAD